MSFWGFEHHKLSCYHLHYTGEKAVISTAGMCKTSIRWIKSPTGERRKWCFSLGWTVPLVTSVAVLMDLDYRQDRSVHQRRTRRADSSLSTEVFGLMKKKLSNQSSRQRADDTCGCEAIWNVSPRSICRSHPAAHVSISWAAGQRVVASAQIPGRRWWKCVLILKKNKQIMLQFLSVFLSTDFILLLLLPFHCVFLDCVICYTKLFRKLAVFTSVLVYWSFLHTSTTASCCELQTVICIISFHSFSISMWWITHTLSVLQSVIWSVCVCVCVSHMCRHRAEKSNQSNIKI